MEDATKGKENITPYWRTLKSGGEVNPKYPEGIDEQKKTSGIRRAYRNAKREEVFYGGV
ncbi:MAG: hypothetical protein SVY10_16330 [Thermodesulfobacteriota bacterium]|nr:hypothetical protein [Thermodesulfobacteriota bacterium]